jgi:hypothetical protein
MNALLEALADALGKWLTRWLAARRQRRAAAQAVAAARATEQAAATTTLRGQQTAATAQGDTDATLAVARIHAAGADGLQQLQQDVDAAIARANGDPLR